jgi:hypothetical protein
MAELPDLKDVLAGICAEWDKAEIVAKAAEQVCEEVIFPSIMEFRYAGRRLIQALEVISSGGDEAKARALLQDALFNCHRARHDAIDAGTSQISITITSAIKNLRPSAVLTAFPDFVRLNAAIQRIKGKIPQSRASQDDRDALYEAIEGADFPDLLRWFELYQTSEPMMVELSKEHRRERIISRWALMIATLALLVAGAALVYEVTKDHLQSAPVSARTPTPLVSPGNPPQPPKP